MRLLQSLLVATLLSSAAGCATGHVAGECPEARGRRCLTERVCSYDRARGCSVCICQQPWDPDRDTDRRGRGDVPVPPSSR